MKPIRKKSERMQFSWLNPEENHKVELNEASKKEFKAYREEASITEEISKKEVNRRKLLSGLLFGGMAAGLGGYAVYKTIDYIIEKTKLKIIKDVTSGEILSAYVEAPFDKGKEALEKEGYEIISLEESARLRMQTGTSTFVSTEGNFVREAIIYVPGKGKFLTKNSPIMENPKEATECHRKGIEYYLTDGQVEKALERAVEIEKALERAVETEKALERAVEIKITEIPINKFKDDELTVFAFGNSAEKYGEFLKKNKFKEMLVSTVNLQEKPFSRQLLFNGLLGAFVIISDCAELYHGYSLRGALKKTI